MYKLIITISNNTTSPLEPVVLNESKIIEIIVEDIYNTEEILRKVEPFVMKIDGQEKTTLNIEIKKESGEIVFAGYLQNGSLSGIISS